MRTYTNLARPEDVYRTGQQLYRRPGPLLTAFASWPGPDGAGGLPFAFAVVYLPLHRTRAVAVTEGTLAFGFRAVSVRSEADLPALVGLADLELMRARSQAEVLAGEALPGELAALRRLVPGRLTRGLSAVQVAWPNRAAVGRGLARMIDTSPDLPGGMRTDGLKVAGIVNAAPSGGTCGTRPGGPATPGDEELVAAEGAGQALLIALAGARHLGRYEWAGRLRVAALMRAAGWDCFPGVTWHDDGSAAERAGTSPGPPGEGMGQR